MASIIEKRRSLHKNLIEKQQQNKSLQLKMGQLQSLANIGANTFMIAHEINNLLTPISNYSELALRNREDKELAEKALNKTVQNCQRAYKIMTSMLSVTTGEAKEKKYSVLKVLIEEIFECLCRDFSKDGIEVNIHIPDDLKVWAVPVEIQQVFMNLILNARDAMLKTGGCLNIMAREDESNVHIKVNDTGCGIEKKNLKNIFDLFFTTKKDDQCGTGSGLGLYFCKKVIEQHNGSITVESSDESGTCFEIILPVKMRDKR